MSNLLDKVAKVGILVSEATAHGPFNFQTLTGRDQYLALSGILPIKLDQSDAVHPVQNAQFLKCAYTFDLVGSKIA
jgi:hypothetical protein